MLVAVVSDTHGITEYIEKVKRMINKSDILIHLGDNITDLEYIIKGYNGKVYGVKGNCDFSNNYPLDMIVEILDKKIFITHGHKYNVKYDLNSIYFKAKEVAADAALFGHTHQSLVTQHSNIWLVNPGSASLPRMSKRSIAFIEVEEGKPLYPYLVEL
ncbi:phosphoesterase [Clostridium zeae]|uniref:Phosphoesterase n=1 Tax=Clostridium zeae TaxID=2759022 RepID=A0ABQ1ECK4_9CLOT|nr:metallophosphoesterase [Clostridium zeae]GFZ32471.1 phosphoesterase [Clostridium zeae]